MIHGLHWPVEKAGGKKGLRSGPVSRVLLSRQTRPAIIYLGCRLLDTSRSLPESRGEPDQFTVGTSPTSSLLGLAPGGVYLAERVASLAGELLPHRFTLTRENPGGLLSVALSLTSQPVGVTDHLVLRSPDFPPADVLPHPPAITRPTSAPIS